MRILVLGPVDRSLVARQVDESGRAPYGPPVTDLVRHLAAAGHEIHVVTHRRGEGPYEAEAGRIRFSQVGSRSARAQGMDQFAREISAMRNAAADSHADVVHAHWTYEWALSALALGNQPMVATIHDAPLRVLLAERSPYSLIRLMMAARFRASRGSAHLCAVSPYVARSWNRDMWDSRPVHVIPNMVEQLESVPAKALRPTIVEVASTSRLKNVSVLLDAFGSVRARIPDAELRLIGSGLTPDSQLAAPHRDLVEAGAVQFLGQLTREGVKLELAKAWVHAHVSLEESFGMSIAEAMIHGTPVVGGAFSGAVPWILGHGVLGQLVDIKSSDAIAGAIVGLLEDDGERARAASAAKLAADRLFAPSAVVSATLSLYDRVMGS